MSEREKAVGQKIVERLGKFVDELQPVPLQPGQEVWVRAVVSHVDNQWDTATLVMQHISSGGMLTEQVVIGVPFDCIHPAPQPAKKGE